MADIPNMLHLTTTDEDLLQAVKDWRNDEGWRAFHRKYASAIIAHARRSGLTKEEAEDVVQTTMLKVAKYLPKFEYDRTVCRFRTWLNQIVNQRIMAIWRERRKSRLPEAAWVYLSELIAGAVNPAADPAAQAELEQRMLEVCLVRARKEARPRHWQIFEANALLGLSADTVAKRFRTTTANVWVIRHRLLKQLRSEWQALLNEPFGRAELGK
jgi:RNA polymerase sigma factor (sigma-70 family)